MTYGIFMGVFIGVMVMYFLGALKNKEQIILVSVLSLGIAGIMRILYWLLGIG